jgi:hypothetical protein
MLHVVKHRRRALALLAGTAGALLWALTSYWVGSSVHELEPAPAPVPEEAPAPAPRPSPARHFSEPLRHAARTPERRELRTAPAVAAGGSAVSGCVRDASGGTIPGALLAARAQGNPVVLATSYTNDTGCFTLPLPELDVSITASAEAYSMEVREARAPTVNLDFVLAPESSLVGRVVTRGDGAPVAGIQVVATGSDGPRAQELSVESKADGTFLLARVPAGNYDVVALGPQARSEIEPVYVGIGQQSAEVVLAVAPASVLRGVVRLSSGPCGEGQVSLAGPIDALQVVARDGSVTFDGLWPGHYLASVSCAGALSQTEELELYSEPSDRTWLLDSGLVLQGIVRGELGQPLPGVQVDVGPRGEPSDRPNVSCNTDDNGEFACAGLLAGEYGVSAASNPQQPGDEVAVVLTPESGQYVELRVAATANLRVATATTTHGAADALTVLARRGADSPPLVASRRGDAFLFESLQLGAYQVFVEGFPEHVAQVELLQPDATVDVALPLPARATIVGRVVDAAGAPLPDAWIRATRRSGFAPSTQGVPPVLSDAEGSFELTGLFAGEYDLSASSALGEARAQRVSAGARRLELRVSSFGSISGSVTASDGRPVPRFVVAYRLASDDDTRQVVGNAGRFSVPWTAPGHYRFVVSAEQGAAQVEGELEPGGKLVLTVALDRAQIDDLLTRLTLVAEAAPAARLALPTP